MRWGLAMRLARRVGAAKKLREQQEPKRNPSGIDETTSKQPHGMTSQKNKKEQRD